ncbi:hypothetical protein LIER_36130 [Lithospermum erythrorhizon]|uniref:Transposase (putative) gypsy type domain-containing protein n=1 Tax=Lithospermum erythrorhizon TaxID=34254 RepID=A0AAV3P608_LITER
MLSFPWEYLPEKHPSPLNDPPEEFWSTKRRSSSSPNRENSPIHTIDANTLNKEETYDDIFEEIDNYPSNLIAPETPAEGVVQSTSEQDDDPGYYPSYIMNSLPVPFIDSELWDIKEYLSIADDVGIRVPIEGESIMAPIVKGQDVEGVFCPGWTPLFLAAFSFGMRLPFSMFVNDLLEHVTGQIHPIGWLNIIIFQVACNKAEVQAIVPLFASLFTSKHMPFDTSLAAKGDGRLSQNFLVGPRPNKVHKNRFDGQWVFVRGGIGPRVPIRWTTLREAYPSKVEVAAMKGKRLPHFSSQLLIRKPLVPGASPIPIVSSKMSSTLEASPAAYKKAKIEALNAVTSASSNPQPLQTVVISLDDELTTSAQEAAGAKKEKSKVPFTVRTSKMMLPFLAKAGASSKKNARRVGKRPLSLKEREEELYSAKEALYAQELKCKQLQEEKQTMELNHAKNYSTLEAEMLKLKNDHSSLAKNVEDSRSTCLEATKRA